MRHTIALAFASLLSLVVVAHNGTKTEDVVLYLHLYSNRYDIHTMSSDLPPPPRDYQCILTFALHPGKRVFARVPNHYEPEIEVDGTVTRSGDTLSGKLTFSVQDVGISYVHRHKEHIDLNRFVPFEIDDDFQFAITETDTALPPPMAKQRGG